MQVDSKEFYATDDFTTRAMQFIREREKTQPFFLYLAFNAPHSPLHARDEDIERIGDRYAVGWDVMRRRRFEKMKQLGILPAHAMLPPADWPVIPGNPNPSKPNTLSE